MPSQVRHLRSEVHGHPDRANDAEFASNLKSCRHSWDTNRSPLLDPRSLSSLSLVAVSISERLEAKDLGGNSSSQVTGEEKEWSRDLGRDRSIGHSPDSSVLCDFSHLLQRATSQILDTWEAMLQDKPQQN